MTFDLVLSSLYYHGREWFVFQDILTHLSQEKAAAATQRSKTTSKYTYRFGITRDWVTGESKKILVERHFIDSNDPGRSLIFSSVLIDAGRVEELFHESFTKKFRLKVQQFHLTSNSLDACWFEWHFDPKQKEGLVVKKTKLTVDENDRRSSKKPDKTPPKDQNRHSDSENLTPNMSTESPQSLKRRRSALENGSSEGNQSASEYLPTISEAVLMRPRKKAKEANLSISKYLDENEQQDDDFLTKEEPMSPDFKPDLTNFPDIKIKRSLSPSEKPEVKLSPNSSPQRIVRNDVMLSSVSARDNNAGSDTDCDQGTIGVPKEKDANPQNIENSNPSDELTMQNNDSVRGNDIESSNDVLQVKSALDNHDLTKRNDGNSENSDNNNATEAINTPNNNPVDSSTEGSNSSDDGNVPDSNVPDDDNIVPEIVPQTPSSPTSSLLDNSKDIMENIKLREQELCNDEVVVGDKIPEVPSTSVDTNCQAATHKHDCGATACNGNGASSTVCLCAGQEPSKQEKTAETVRSNEASELLDGLIAAGFIDHVRQLFENVKDDTRLSKMEADLNTLRNQINQKRKANHQLQKSIKKKAGELEKLFDNLRRGKAHCEMLEQKHRDLQKEKSTVEAKVKKCLEVLNAVD